MRDAACFVNEYGGRYLQPRLDGGATVAAEAALPCAGHDLQDLAVRGWEEKKQGGDQVGDVQGIRTRWRIVEPSAGR